MDFYIVVTTLYDGVYVYNVPVKAGENPITFLKQYDMLEAGETVVDVKLFDPTIYSLVAIV